MRGWCTTLLILLVALLWSGSASAFAQCDRYKQEDEALVTGLRSFLWGHAPLKDQELIREITIEFVDAPGQFGPYAIPEDGRNFIRIPKGFLHLQCELIISGALHAASGLVAHHTELCLVKRQASLSDCLRRALARYSPVNQRAYDAADPGMRATIDQFMINPSIYFLMLHEVAHFTLRHWDKEDSITDAEIELEADMYAAQYSVLSGAMPASGTFVFLPLSYIDEGVLRAYLGEEAYSSHDSFRCRFENSSNIFSITEGIPAHLDILPGSRQLAELSDPSEVIAGRKRAMRIIAGGGNSMGGKVTYSPQCRVQSLPHLEKVRKDFVALVRFQSEIADSLPAPNDGPGVAAIIRRLTGLELTTAEGRGLRISLIANYADSYRTTQSDRDVTRALMAVFDLPDIFDAAGMDWGIITRQVAQRRFYFPLNGTLGPDEYDPVYTLFATGLNFAAHDAETYAGLVRLEIWAGQCDHARELIEEGFGPDHIGRFDPAVRAVLLGEQATCRPRA